MPPLNREIPITFRHPGGRVKRPAVSAVSLAVKDLPPGAGVDRCEILSDNEKIVTPAGTFEKCIHVVETSALEKGLHDHKRYAAGAGQVKDAGQVLVKYGVK